MIIENNIKSQSKSEIIQIDTTVLTRLIQLSPFEYDRVRNIEAKNLGIRVITLDKIVKSAQTVTKKTNSTPFLTINPWHEQISPAILLQDIKQTIHRFIPCEAEIVIAATLWIAMTWFIDVIQIALLIVITTIEKCYSKNHLNPVIDRHHLC